MVALIVRFEGVNGFDAQLFFGGLLFAGAVPLKGIPVNGVVRFKADRVAVWLVAFDVELAFENFELSHWYTSLASALLFTVYLSIC